ncbi:MAG: hypothetical protein KatS3mg009_1265 [Acidimicrobiia bacterium]|nr:MAG: hypothetical protein KatS3mg009_1265 [Acidimicrobiia bacterium]
MLALGLALAVSMLIPLVTGGSYSRLVMTNFRAPGLLYAGLGIQLALEYLPIPESRWHDVGFGLLVASYVLILGFCAGNLILRGMAIVMIGVACNALVITLNQGMPVEDAGRRAGESWIEPTIKHHLADDDTRLLFLGDIIVVPEPFGVVISFGDLILAVGLCDLTYWASRRPRRATATARVGADLPGWPGAAAREGRGAAAREGRGAAVGPARRAALDLDPYVGGAARGPTPPAAPHA